MVERIGILGAGRVGTAIARQAVKAGYEVMLATARPADEIRLITELMVPGGRAVAADEAAKADIVVLAMPLSKFATLPPSCLAGRVVVDVMNYWPPTDGVMPDFETGSASSEVVQRHLPEARLVRTLNHIGYHELEEQALPAGHAERQALALAGDDPAARELVAAFIDRLGYDPVDAGALAASRKFDAGTPIFGGRLRRPEMEAVLGLAGAAAL